MKKKIILVIILILFILLIPIPNNLKDGGTIEYKSLTYKISKVHTLNHNSKSGYDDGIIINILGNQVYNNVPKNIENKDAEKEHNYSKTINNVTLSMNIPNDWQYEELPQDENNNFYKYALKLYKSQKSKSVILYFYNNPFAVCGTGRTTEKINLDNGKKAIIGYYSNTEWSDISFYDLNPYIAFINNGLENEEAEEVLDFVKTITIE